jgi:hypothetical protein
MAKFPLPAPLSAVHDEALLYATAVQNHVAARGGCHSLSCEALNILAHNAIVTHRSVRTLCEEGWTPITAVLNRTLLDIFANCVAVCNVQATSEYMAYKFISHFYRKWLVQPGITDPERNDATIAVDVLARQLSASDQQKARELRAEPSIYWFQPEYRSVKQILALAQHQIYGLFQMYSGATHGGFDMKMLLNDDPRSEDIDPREHPRNVPKGIVACSRLLAEVSHIRDNWDNRDANENQYTMLVRNIIALRA